jgi:uncharacterized protein YukJ
MWGEVYERLIDDQWPHNPHFAKNSHEWPFSIIPKANTYGFLTKNGLHEKSKNMIYGKETYVGWGVWASGRWSMATQPPFFMKIAMSDLENSHERPFSIILEANTYGFLTKNGLHEKSKNVIYGKETYVGWGVWSSGRWSMATQPPFLSKIAMNDHFQ